MPNPFFIIDTFTSIPFRGNPTGVIVLQQQFEASLLLSLANELNFPVTAFIQKTATDHFSIRYFTPITEIPACGHATLAAAKVAFTNEQSGQVSFTTIEGICIEVNSKEEIIWMTYPKYNLQAYALEAGLWEALGSIEFTYLGFCPQLESLFIEIADPATLRKARPNFPQLLASSDTLKEIVLMSISDDPEFDFLLRSFCPWIGIDEDPVTGSVHSVLAHYWAEKLGKTQLKAYQCSQRGGEVFVKALTDQVQLGGQVFLLAEGKLDL